MLKGFKDFVMRGNVLDLAVAVVIGTAFAKVVDGLLKGIINPLIAALFGEPDLTRVGNFTINDARFSIGLVLQETLNFLLIAAAVYFVLIVPMNKLLERRKAGVEPEPEQLTTDQQLLTEIRDALRNPRP